ncbi:SAVMC3_10250 family protein [Saccharopolyspora karakumensis]|uniref:SAVMC3_10250 family protein n=1 Tax=Saccharopolyspora karakumensis TaxID=2530386 RepID=UPI00268C2B9C
MRFKAALSASLGLFKGSIEAEADPATPTIDRARLKRKIDAIWGERDVACWPELPSEQRDWLHFEARLGVTTVSQAGQAVVFCDPDGDSPVDEQVRLVLHGSARHLLRYANVPYASPKDLAAQGEVTTGFGAESFASLWTLFQQLIELEFRHELSSTPQRDSDAAHFGKAIGPSGLAHVLPTLRAKMGLPHAWQWMGGLAEVTAVVQTNGNTRRLCLPRRCMSSGSRHPACRSPAYFPGCFAAIRNHVSASPITWADMDQVCAHATFHGLNRSSASWVVHRSPAITERGARLSRIFWGGAALSLLGG